MRGWFLLLFVFGFGIIFGEGMQVLGEQDAPLPARSSRFSEPLKVVSAERVSRRGDETVWEGGVVLEYKGYTLRAARIEGNLAANTFLLTGGAVLQGEGDQVEGETVFVDFNAETYSFRDGRAVIQPSRTQGVTTGPFFVSAGSGGLRTPHFHVVDGVLTPCDKEHPHFSFTARKADLEPGRRLLMRDVGLVILGREVLRLPHLYVPLLDDRPGYLPEFGQTPDEGYFVKSRFVTPIRGEDTWETRLDYMTRLGAGLGGEWRYLGDSVTGSLGAYGLTGSRRSLVANWIYNQVFGPSRLNLDTRYQRDNYLTAPGTTLLTSRGQLSVPWAGGLTNFGYFRTGSSSGTFSSTNQSFSVNDSRDLGLGLRTQFAATYTDNSSEGGGISFGGSRLLDLRLQGTQETRSLTAELLYQRSIPAGGQLGFSGTSDRTPLLTLTSDFRRIFGADVGTRFPFRLSGSVGELRDAGSGGAITRITAEVQGSRTERIGRGLDFSWDGQYRQGLYSDDTAQYVLGYGGQLQYAVGRRSRVSLNYRNLRQFGFTPLSLDLSGRADAFNFSAALDFGRGWSGTAQTGYDLLSIERSQTPWNLVSFGARYQGAGSAFQLSGNYDTFRQVWGTFRADGRFSAFGANFNAATRYDASRSVWGSASLQVEGLQVGRFRSDFLLFYNGFTRRMDAQQYSISYDLHCTEAVLEITDFRSGFRSGRQIAFYIRIKALPFGSNFGLGRQGQRIGGSGGFGS